MKSPPDGAFRDCVRPIEDICFRNWLLIVVSQKRLRIKQGVRSKPAMPSVSIKGAMSF